MNFKLIAMTAASAAVLTAGVASAQDRAEPNPWVDCGIGAMIFPDDNLEPAAAISNIIWDLGTTAVTSAMSSPETCEGTGNVRSAMFIQRTYATLETELAKGHGDYVLALADLYEVADKDAFAASLRTRMAAEVAAADFAALTYEEKAQSLYFAAEAAAAEQLG